MVALRACLVYSRRTLSSSFVFRLYRTFVFSHGYHQDLRSGRKPRYEVPRFYALQNFTPFFLPWLTLICLLCSLPTVCLAENVRGPAEQQLKLFEASNLVSYTLFSLLCLLELVIQI